MHRKLQSRSQPTWKEVKPCMLMQAVQRFALSPTAAAAHIAALAQLTALRADTAIGHDAAVSQGLPDTAAWGSTVLQAAEEELGRFVEQVSSPDSCWMSVEMSCLPVE